MEISWLSAICVLFIVVAVYYMYASGGSTASGSRPIIISSAGGGPTGQTKKKKQDDSAANLSYAETLAIEAKRHGFNGKAIDLVDFDPEVLSSHNVAMFVMATYGEGDPTDNSADFMKWLEDCDNTIAPDLLKKMRFSVFGLGNRTYEHFNRNAKRTDKWLPKYGAERIYEIGIGNEDGDMEAQFDEWKEGLWPALRKRFGSEAGAEVAGDASGLPDLPELKFRVVKLRGEAAEQATSVTRARLNSSELRHFDLSSRGYFEAVEAKVLVNRELRQSACSPGETIDTRTAPGSTRHIEIDIRDNGLQYDVADNLGVCPENDPNEVEAMARWLEYDLDMVFDLKPAEAVAAAGGGSSPVDDAEFKPLFPTPCTVREALSRYCDFQNKPSKALLGQLGRFATKGSERERISHLVSKAGKDDFHDFVVTAQRSIKEVLNAFPSVRIPLEMFFLIVPRLQPRYYTICSSPHAHPHRIHIASSLISQAKPGNEPRFLRGVSSTYLMESTPPPTDGGRRVDGAPGQVKPKDKVRAQWPIIRCFVRPSTFKLPQDPATPVIMIGPGTGVAPMRAFLQERAWQREQGMAVGATLLFFGCRRRDEDYIYENELMEYSRNKTLTALYTAFSREDASKVYVQSRLAEHAEQVWGLIQNQGAHIYVCGATRMGTDVHAVLEGIVAEHGQMPAEQAKQFIKDLQKCNRYVQELWS